MFASMRMRRVGTRVATHLYVGRLPSDLCWVATTRFSRRAVVGAVNAGSSLCQQLFVIIVASGWLACVAFTRCYSLPLLCSFGLLCSDHVVSVHSFHLYVVSCNAFVRHLVARSGAGVK